MLFRSVEADVLVGLVERTSNEVQQRTWLLPRRAVPYDFACDRFRRGWESEKKGRLYEKSLSLFSLAQFMFAICAENTLFSLQPVINRINCSFLSLALIKQLINCCKHL